MMAVMGQVLPTEAARIDSGVILEYLLLHTTEDGFSNAGLLWQVDGQDVYHKSIQMLHYMQIALSSQGDIAMVY